MIVEAIRFSDSSGNYDIYYDQSYAFRGQKSLYINIKDILMLKDQEVSVWARHKFSGPLNYIPFLHLLGVRQTTHKFNVYDDLTKIAQISHEEQFHRSRYKIELASSEILYVYVYYEKGFYYLSVYKTVYKKETQIAFIEKQLHASELNQKCKLYLLDEYKDLANVLSIFLLYFDGRTNSSGIRIRVGVMGGSFGIDSNDYGRQYVPIFNSYKEKYDRSWRETNFPNENYWGAVNIENE